MRWLSAVSLLLVTACRSSSRAAPQPDALVRSEPTQDVATGPLTLLRPFGALHGGPGLTFVAGLSLDESHVVVAGLDDAGHPRWSREVLDGVRLGPNASVGVIAHGAGAIVLWRGMRNGASAQLGVVVDAQGHTRGTPFTVGPAACGDESSTVWVERNQGGSWAVRVLGAGVDDSPAAVAVTLQEDREPTLLCGTRHAFVLGDGEDDTTLTVLPPEQDAGASLALRKGEFKDDERSHEPFVIGDDLGLLRMGTSGAMETREWAGSRWTPWRKLSATLLVSDDLALVDGNRRDGVLLLTREAASHGENAPMNELVAVVWQRTSRVEKGYEVAGAVEALARGPYWSGGLDSGVVVAWPERAPKALKGAAPVTSLAYRLLSSDAMGSLVHIPLAADDIIDAGCDATRCYAITASPLGSGVRSERVDLLAYP